MNKVLEADVKENQVSYGILEEELKEFDKYNSDVIQDRGTITSACTGFYTLICC